MDMIILNQKSGEALRKLASSNQESYVDLIDYETNTKIDATNVDLISTKKEYLQKKDKGLFIGSIKSPRGSDEGELFDHIIINLDPKNENNDEIIKTILDTLHNNNHTFSKPQGNGIVSEVKVEGKKQLLYAVHNENNKLHLHIHLNRHAIKDYDLTTKEISTAESLLTKYVLNPLHDRLNQRLAAKNLQTISSVNIKKKDYNGISADTKNLVRDDLTNNNTNIEEKLSLDNQELKFNNTELLEIEEVSKDENKEDNNDYLENTNRKSIENVIKEVDKKNFLLTSQEVNELSTIYDIRAKEYERNVQKLLDEKNILIQLSKTVSLHNNYVSVVNENEKLKLSIEKEKELYENSVKEMCNSLSLIDDKYINIYDDFKENKVSFDELNNSIKAQIEDLLISNSSLYSEKIAIKRDYDELEEKIKNDYISNDDHIQELSVLKEEFEAKIENDYVLKQSHISEIEGLKQSHINEIEGLKQSHINEIEGLKQSHINEIEGLKQSHIDDINKNYVSKEDYLKLKNLLENERLEKENVINENKTLVSVNETLKKANDALNSANNTLQNANETLENSNRNLASSNENLKSANDKLNLVNKELEEKLSLKEIELKKEITDKINIKDKLDEIKNKLISIFEKILKAKNINELKKDVNIDEISSSLSLSLRDKINKNRPENTEDDIKNKNKPR